MPLVSGDKLGPYEIVSPLGAGGMGEVYRARDSKLKREVAIKVLPADVANDRERLARFQREAEVLASLNHPHIAHVYGIEDPSTGSGQAALVMELVEGEDLSQRISRGAISIDEALPIAKQIAEALEAAHDAGIIHRDLKPANIKVRDDGTVKVLDFGLAKGSGLGDQGSGGQGSGDLANSPTITSPALTMRGVILGTAAYMAPEQAKGKPVDKRADIWAFGCVLYEILTGRAPFGGETITDVIAAVVKSDPDWNALDASTPPRVRRLLERCLTKDPRARLRDIGDARILFEEDERPAPSIASHASRNRWAGLAPWAITAIIVIAAAATIASPSWRTTSARPPLRFVEPIPTPRVDPHPVLAPDGSFLVYVTDSLRLRQLSELETHEIPGTTSSSGPFVSPDGRWIGFYADGKLKKIAVDGREPIEVADVSADSAGAAFASSDRIVFSPGWYRSAIHSVSAEGGPTTKISSLDEAAGERGHWWPDVLPDGRHVLITIWYASTGLSTAKIGVLDLDTGTHRVLFAGAMARYTSGHVLFFRGGQYYLAPFEPSTQTMTGEAVPVLPDALSLDPTGDSDMPVAVSVSGAVAYWPGERSPIMAFTWVDRHGQFSETSIRSEADGASLSPDDQQVAVGRPQGGLSKIWIFDLAGGGRPLANNGASWNPTWHPDGRRVLYTTIGKGEYDVATQALDGPPQIALGGDVDEAAIGWLANGRMVVREWSAADPTILLVGPGNRRTALVTGDFDTNDGRVSPDGRWLAVCANPGGSYALYVRPIAESGSLERMAAANPSCDVRWSAATKELVFRRGATLIALAYDEREGRLTPLRETNIAVLPDGSDLYGVTRDGARFLIGIPPPVSVPVTGIRIIIDGIAALSQGTR
jgi:serine/threonine protein kinase